MPAKPSVRAPFLRGGAQCGCVCKAFFAILLIFSWGAVLNVHWGAVRALVVVRTGCPDAGCTAWWCLSLTKHH